MLRFEETGDVKRLVRLRDRLNLLQTDLAIVSEMKRNMEAARTAPKFRKSYSFEFWCDSLATGQN